MRTLSIFTTLLAALLISCCTAPDITPPSVSFVTSAPSIVESPPVEDAGVDAAIDAGLEDAALDSPCTCEDELISDGSVDENS